MARGNAYRFAHFARGLNTAVGPYALREGYEDDPSGLGAEARDLINVVSRRRGNVSRRDGCTNIAALSDQTELITSISIIGQDSTGFAVCSTDDGRLIAIDESDPGAVTELVASGLSASAPWAFKRATVQSTTYGPAYGCNGIDTARETDGTGGGTGNWTASSGTFPGASGKGGSLLEYHDNSFWISGVVTSGSFYDDAVYWSYPGDARNWPAENVVRFAPDDGSPITAIVSSGPYLVVFKERGIWVIYDSSSGANRKVVDDAGTISPRSVVAGRDGVYFLDPQHGVMLFNGASVKKVSEQLDLTFVDTPYANKATASAALWNGHYYLAFDDTYGQRVYDLDTDTGSWWRHSPEVENLAVWDRGSGPILVASTADTGNLWELFKPGELYDDGVIFESYWQGPYHTFGDPDLRKRCREVHVDGRGTVSLFVNTDYAAGPGDLEGVLALSEDAGTFGGSGNQDGSDLFGSGSSVGEDSVFALGTARAWSVSVYSAAAQSWELDAYTMRMTKRSD